MPSYMFACLCVFAYLSSLLLAALACVLLALCLSCASLATTLGHYGASVLLRALLGTLGEHFGLSWVLLGLSWRSFGPVLGPLGPLLASLGPLLGLFWASLGPLGGLPGTLLERDRFLTALGHCFCE